MGSAPHDLQREGQTATVGSWRGFSLTEELQSLTWVQQEVEGQPLWGEGLGEREMEIGSEKDRD